MLLRWVVALCLCAAPAFAQDKLPVVASFSILADMVRQIGGARVEVSSLVGPGQDVHVYAPTPQDARRLTQARLIVINGLKFEGWIDRLVKSSGAKARIAVATKGIAPLKEQGSGHGHGHDHADPHAWQSLSNAKIYVANIRAALIDADPAGKADYEAQAQAYLAQLSAVETELRAAIAAIPAERRKIITTHDAFGYFAAAYGVEFIAPVGVSTESEASAQDVARIIRQIRAQKIPAVFLENVTDPRLARQIAAESGAKLGGALYSDSLSPPDGPAGTYIDMVRHNIRELKAALIP
jgi:zinc/manganese transport system substrate-binding protein